MSHPQASPAAAPDDDARFDAAFREAAVRELSQRPPPIVDIETPPGPQRIAERRATFQRLVAGIVGVLGLFVIAVLALSFAGCLPG